ncbi:kelch-like protein 26 [Ylistrum balloti]|uniref:kelch-like protein 26 n=1 Tax=Ylistrum balloti TaxID=509963 RepID=UPI002905DD47|nr:kelch-like protein 26 [Ylistrum balloti]
MATGDNSHLAMEECSTVEFGRLMMENMYESYMTGHLCDFSVKVEGNTYRVHKIVLASCSDYFKAVFSHDMLESRQEYVELKGLTEKGVHPLIKYAYTGSVILTLDNIQDVICAATFLQMTAAVDLCIEYLKKKMTFDNAEELLGIGEILSIPTLKVHYREYILENFLQFSETESFLKLDPDTLIDYLIDDHLRTTTELQLLKAALRWYEHDPKARECKAFDVLDKIRYVVDGWPAIEYAMKNEPFRSNKKCRDIVKFCTEYMVNATKRYTYYDHRTRVRFETKTLVQFGGVTMFDLYEDTEMPPDDFGDRCGWERNHFYHTDLKHWFPLGCVRVMEAMSHLTVTEVNDCSILCGGYVYDMDEDLASRSATRQVRMFTPSHLSIWDMESMKHERAQHAAVYLPGNIYVIGGKDNKQPLASVEKHECEEGMWYYVKPLPKPLYDHAAAVAEGKIYVTGGVEVTPTNKMWCFDPLLNKWHKKASLLQARAGHGMVSLGGVLYVCGGYREMGFEGPNTESCLDSVESYTLQTRQWTSLAPMPISAYDVGIVVLNEKILVAGGETLGGDLISNIQQYDPQQNRWTQYGRLERQLKGLGLCAVTVKFAKKGPGDDYVKAFTETEAASNVCMVDAGHIEDSDDTDDSEFFLL